MGKGGPEIIFVYDSESGPGAQVYDFVHKALSPRTYPCNLCKITYGTFTKKQEWKEFVKSLPFRPVFLYRNQFRKQYPDIASSGFPAVFLKAEGGIPVPLARPQDINKQHSVEELKELLQTRLR
jgi:hypothetical protein